MKLRGILLHSLSIQNLSVMLASIKVFIVVSGKSNLLLVISKLQICDIVLHWLRNILSLLPLLLALLLLLL
jgi:hypothetical protein